MGPQNQRNHQYSINQSSFHTLYWSPVADLGGGCGGAAAPPLASFTKIQGLPISKIARTADSTIIIITDFHLAASSHEIFLRVKGREGIKGLGALQRHQLPHPSCKNSGSATAEVDDVTVIINKGKSADHF